MGSPAVIFQANFEYKWHIGGYDYLEYMNRPEAFDKTKHLRDEYKDFIDYMQNSEKSDGLFDAESDLLNAEQIEAYRCQETISQSEGCPKYYGVISFRNDFLQETGVLAADGRLDVGLLKQLTREGMSELIGTSRKLDAANVYWNAAIHTNTDNIHVHYTLCEYHRKENRRAVYRDGDMLELKAFEALKSKVVNRLLGNDFSKQLTEFERGVLLNGIRMSAPSCKEQLVDLARVLPPEGGWQYNRPKMRKYREQIDRCAMSIIRSDESLSQSFDEYIKKLDSRAVDLRDNIYGSNKTQRYLDFKKNRLDDFKARAGNIVLKHIADSELQALLAAGRGSAHPSEEINLASLGEQKQSVFRDAVIWDASENRADPSEGKKYDLPPFVEQLMSLLDIEPPPIDEMYGDYPPPEEIDDFFFGGDDDMESEKSVTVTLSENSADPSEEEKIYCYIRSDDLRLANQYLYNKESEADDYNEAEKLLLRECSRGNILAMESLSKLYSLSKFERQDAELAEQYKQSGYQGLLAIEPQAESIIIFDQKYSKPPKSKDIRAEVWYKLGRANLYGSGTDKDAAAAYDWMIKSASLDNATALYALGSMYRYGQGCEQDDKTALEYYLRSANAEKRPSPYAAYAAARMYEHGIGTVADSKSANQYYSQAFFSFSFADEQDKADDRILYKLGLMYKEGLGTDTDLAAALDCFRRAGKSNNVQAMFESSCLLLEHPELSEQPEAAVKEALAALEKAAGLGDTRSIRFLGKQYLSGEYVEKSTDKGIELLNRGRELGDKYCSYALAKLYLSDDCKNLDLAVDALKDAASSEQLRPFANYKLAKIYLDPESEYYDLDKAIESLRIATEQEQLRPFANYKLAKIYLEDPKHRNEPEAIILLESIAEQNSYAAYRLGRLYLWGTDQMPADKEKGLAYLQLAAAHDHKGAEQLLDRLAHLSQNRPKPRHRHYVQQRGDVAANLQMLLRSISSNMEQAHRAAMREFEQQEWLNEQRGRLY